MSETLFRRSYDKTRLVVAAVAMILLVGSCLAQSSLTEAIIRTSGIISPTLEIVANSGSAADIQAAVDQLAAIAGRGRVRIPAGNFNFVDIGQPWRTVSVPAGIDILGASSPKDANGFNEGFFDSPTSGTWLTVLKMPYNVPGVWGNLPSWFTIGNGAQDPTKPSRFSDIKIQGYRSINSSSVTLHQGIAIYGVIDFRIDHCMFEHVAGGAIVIPLWHQQSVECSGVIDHSKFINVHGYDNLVNGAYSTIGYGINVGRAYYATASGDPIPYDPTMEILGQYNTHTVFIEDNYFSKWRHCVTEGHGGYYVFRHNLINKDFGHFSLDVHGLRDSEPNRCGGRGCEVYENVFGPTESTDEGDATGNGVYLGVMQDGGGSGVFFNNVIDSSYQFISLYSEDYVASEVWHLKDFYLWGKNGTWAGTGWVGYPRGPIDPSRNVVVDWNRPAYDPTDPTYPNTDPSWSIAGYKPYPYPHPLTLG